MQAREFHQLTANGNFKLQLIEVNRSPTDCAIQPHNYNICIYLTSLTCLFYTIAPRTVIFYSIQASKLPSKDLNNNHNHHKLLSLVFQSLYCMANNQIIA